MAESLQSIKRRATGVKNINQITKAMELVAATKMRKSQEIAMASRAYAYTALDLLHALSSVEHVTLPPIFERRTGGRNLFLLITSDKGLAGSFNSSILKAFDRFLAEEHPDLPHDTAEWIAIGAKAAQHLEKKGAVLRAKFTRVGDYTSLDEVKPIANILINGFLAHEWDRVVIFSMNFRSALVQEVIRREIFPVDPEAIRQTAAEIIPKHGRFAELAQNGQLKLLNGNGKPEEYLIEPSPEEILTNLGQHLILTRVYHLILEANASEHAARRAAMKSASDNARDLAARLNLEYNKSRQALITREIVEIVAGAESLQ